MIGTTTTQPPSPAQAKLMSAAERLIGDVGLEGASMRQIAQDAGYRNVRAVQYHFETKEALIASILSMRRAEMDAARIAMFADAGKSLGDTSSLDLMRYLVMPPFHQKDENGIRNYAKFYRSIIPYIYTFDGQDNLERTAAFTSKIAETLRQRMPTIPDNIWKMRFQAASILTFNFIANFEFSATQLEVLEDDYITQLATMGLAVLEAPYPAD